MKGKAAGVALAGDALKTYEKRQLSLVYIQNEDAEQSPSRRGLAQPDR